MPFLFERGKENIKFNVIKFDNQFVRVDGLDFFGPYFESSNGRFLFAWSDFAPAMGVGGFREKGLGAFVLAEERKVIWTGQAERPNDGKVGDNGVFILNDWMLGDELKGTFLAFDKAGNLLIRHHFTANLYNNGISKNGEFAVCQLCKSDTKDGGTLAFFDIKNRKLLWQKEPDTGWADSYDIDTACFRLLLRYRDLGEIAYGFDGALIDCEKWEKISFDRATGFELHDQAKARFAHAKETQDEKEYEAVLGLLGIALQRGTENYPEAQARIYRTMGEIKEFLGRSREALLDYEKALSLNPKVGLKKKVTSMKVVQGLTKG